MAYYGLVLMAMAYNFIGDYTKSDECFTNAGLFCGDRNEHLLNWIIILEKNGRYEEIIPIIDIMEEPSRVNPFPNKTFLIENRAYYNSSSFLKEFRERIEKRLTEHVVNMTSVKFDFK
jgi:hypothetical protein